MKKKGEVSEVKSLKRRKHLRTTAQGRSCLRSSRGVAFIERVGQAEHEGTETEKLVDLVRDDEERLARFS